MAFAYGVEGFGQRAVLVAGGLVVVDGVGAFLRGAGALFRGFGDAGFADPAEDGGGEGDAELAGDLPSAGAVGGVSGAVAGPQVAGLLPGFFGVVGWCLGDETVLAAAEPAP